jgi:ABC-type transport system involved in multi-copper enzyme maturation permease subunit
VLASWVAAAPGPVLLVLVFAEVGVVTWLGLRHGPGDLIGPLFFYDLIRLARRGRSTLLRCVYALLLLGALCLVYVEVFPGHDLLGGGFSGPQLRPSEMARFARRFFVTLALAQGAAVLVLTPAYLAGAIAEEKERHTLPLLFLTPLYDREIVLGKMFARLTHLAGVLLTGVPILSLMLLWGGVDRPVLLGVVVVTLMTLLSVGSVSILCSVLARTVLTALVSTYLLVVAFGLLCLIPIPYVSSPVAYLVILDQRLRDVPAPALIPVNPFAASAPAAALDPTETVVKMTSLYTVVHGLIALFCGAWAVGQLRQAAQPEEIPVQPGGPNPRLVPVSTAFETSEYADKVYERGPGYGLPTSGHGPPAWAEVLAEEVRPRRHSLRIDNTSDLPLPAYRPPPVTDEPLLWKEMYVGSPPLAGPPPRDLTLVAGLVFLVAAVLGCLILLARAMDPAGAAQTVGAINGVLRVVGILLTTVWCVSISFRTAGSVSRERDHRTLDALLTLPVEREDILRAKWLGGVLRLRTLGYFLVGLLALGLFTGAFHPLAVLLLAAGYGVYIVFLATLGIWVSTVCRTTLWAYVSMALMVLLVFAGSWLVLLNSGPAGEWALQPDDLWRNVAKVGLNPFAAWWFEGFSWDEFADGRDFLFWPRLKAILTGISLLAVLAGIFWLAARQRFRDEAKPRTGPAS